MKTSDLVDSYSEEIQIADFIGLQHFGAKLEFQGIISTVRCFEDNSILKQVLSQPGEVRVLVVDGKGSRRCALMGDIIAGIAIANNWTGIVINGCIRDSVAIKKLDFGVLALGTNPRKSAKENKGEIDEIVSFAGINFTPGHCIFVDEDGIVVSQNLLGT